MPARHRGDGGATRETNSIFSTLRARRAGHEARARARLAIDGSPVNFPSAEVSGTEIRIASPSRKRPADRKKHNCTLLYIDFDRRMDIQKYTYIFTITSRQVPKAQKDMRDRRRYGPSCILTNATIVDVDRDHPMPSTLFTGAP